MDAKEKEADEQSPVVDFGIASELTAGPYPLGQIVETLNPIRYKWLPAGVDTL